MHPLIVKYHVRIVLWYPTKQKSRHTFKRVRTSTIKKEWIKKRIWVEDRQTSLFIIVLKRLSLFTTIDEIEFIQCFKFLLHPSKRPWLHIQCVIFKTIWTFFALYMYVLSTCKMLSLLITNTKICTCVYI